MIYFLSEERLKRDFVNDNLSSEIISQGIQTAQDIYLRIIIGDSLYYKLEDLIVEGKLTGIYKELVDSYIIPYLEYRTMAEIIVPATFKIGNVGVNQVYDNNMNTQNIQTVKYLEQSYIQKASHYENRLTKFLISSNIPEYNNPKDITKSQSTTEQTGLFLGGSRKGGNSNSSKQLIHDNTIRAYVRYDVPQNLSEQQKQIARENIGVSANGDIDINLDNYYTKSETDTAIQNAIDNIDIPDVDLSNYYTKETVNNLLDTLPIPEYTSELVKDDVYTKSEVDERIANVSSGGTVDLSNYYTKDETYNREEIDNLVANSGGGSGEGGTTTVSISSNYITDIGLGGNDDLEFVYNEFFNTDREFTDGIITYRGVQLNNYNSDGDTLTFTHTAIGDDNLVDSFKVDINKSISYKDFTVRTYPNIPNNEIWYKTNNEQPFYFEKEGILSNEYDSELGLYKAVFDGGIQIGTHNELFSKYEGDDTVTEVYFGNEGFVPYACFKNCRALEKVELPFGGENNFNDGADFNSTFVNCKNLKEIIIPANVYAIYNDTFQNCIDLKTIVFLGYPCSIPFSDTIGTNVYRGKKIYYNQGYELPIEIQLMSENYGFETIGVENFTNVPINNFHATYTEQPENNININGGGGGSTDVDLSDYYTKEQVYNRNETYSVSQIDTLISQIPTFSGSYNDLSDKPQVYTTEQVYTKSEIDTQISDLSNQIGNINNLLETI